MRKEFLTIVSNIVETPYEEGLVNGLPNKNHLMYVADAKIKERGFDSTRAIYEHRLRTYDDNGKLVEDTKL